MLILYRRVTKEAPNDVGAIVGGFVFNTLGHPGVTGSNLHSLFVAVVGSALLLVTYHTIFRRG